MATLFPGQEAMTMNRSMSYSTAGPATSRRRCTMRTLVMLPLLTAALMPASGSYAATVSSADIVDGEVKTPDLASAAVTTAKLAGSAVTSAKLAGNAVTGAKVQDDSLTGL